MFHSNFILNFAFHFFPGLNINIVECARIIKLFSFQVIVKCTSLTQILIFQFGRERNNLQYDFENKMKAKASCWFVPFSKRIKLVEVVLNVIDPVRLNMIDRLRSRTHTHTQIAFSLRIRNKTPNIPQPRILLGIQLNRTEILLCACIPTLHLNEIEKSVCQ